MRDIETYSGFGLGLRKDHYADFLESPVPVDFVEVISENFMVDGGKPLRVLEQVRSRHDVVLHGVSLSIGSAYGVDEAYLARLRALADRIEPLWVSDHLCWTRTSAHNSHDLLPLPLTTEALDVVCENVERAQEALGRPMLFENPSSYLSFPEDEMREWEFLSEMVRRTGCYLLLDVNNIYVSAHNHEFSTRDYIGGLPLESVRQIHLAGHESGTIIVDTHDRAVADGVWALYAAVIAKVGPVATMIERDANIPALPVLQRELDRARSVTGASLSQANAA